MTNALAPLVPAEEGHLELGVGKTIWLYAALGSSALLLVYPPTRSMLLVSATLAALTLCAGHSVGLHRGIIHKSY